MPFAVRRHTFTFATTVTAGRIGAYHCAISARPETAMSRPLDFEYESATARMLAEAVERLELALVPVCPEPAPDHSAARQAHARASLGLDEGIDGLLDGMLEPLVRGSRETRH